MNHAIKLFIHDSFFDAFSVLPRKIQKKTREFMKKFKEDPKSSAINYEKISTFRDQSLRTVRIDQKYRAIIQAPEEGNGYHLLWVDNHDEAMDWAQNKVFEWNSSTQSFQMYDKPAAEERKVVTKDKTESTPVLFETYTDSELTQIGVPSDLLQLVRSIERVEHLESYASNIPTDVYEYLYYLSEGISIEDILQEIEAGKVQDTEELSPNAQKNVYVLTDDSDLENILSGDFEKWKLFLHPSQRSIAYGEFKGPLKVTGSAGTGKTVCALHRAKFLSQKLETFDKPILFTTYTKSLTQYLSSVTEKFNIPESEIVINNIDKLILDVAKSSNVIESSSGMINSSQELELWKEIIEYNPSTFDERFLQEEYNDVILSNSVGTLSEYYKTSRIGRSVRIGRQDKTQIWELCEEFKKAKEANYTKFELCNLLIAHYREEVDKPYSYIICDEIQDFSNLELTLLRLLVIEKANDLFLVGDPFQNIYGRRINFSKSGIHIRGRRSRKLKVNYRTTEEIKKKAVSVLFDEVYDDFDGEAETNAGYVSLMHGADPLYQTFSNPEEEDAYIIGEIQKLLINDNVSPSDICIAGRTNKLVDDTKTLLNEFQQKYTDIKASKRPSEAVVVSTFHNLKGHEFKHLLVRGFSKDLVPFKHPDFDTYSDIQKRAYLKQEKSLYYVVFSRAIQTLIITGIGEKSDWIK
ncbi:AAA domain-containing protein [Gelidibacter algens]|uniref:AAA domain-containing protein n=1 Tax=Gelidibacter algens TaxID=49280 RepID=A0A327RQI9_9FLAO|nr:UvrD-helicase domain-containing protein [Gelidibacter algens]RAJ19159.1 AAA domain-containing protein [Gelidibacter algens]